ncbi:hypothetical protein J4E85_010541 [Alternaria conjuncta]|uniref:uncharacterized protein n=1 Tax=Alternaria conjuncta TaxID=181017 RepID=UPI00221F43CF|nr:uncharacterized protein J4E85_010541 [Alternaria conjuncta]KAI4914478.1 hypothetical protein J4E85_010541 [Alternaria conjuncta]
MSTNKADREMQNRREDLVAQGSIRLSTTTADPSNNATDNPKEMMVKLISAASKSRMDVSVSASQVSALVRHTPAMSVGASTEAQQMKDLVPSRVSPMAE